MKCTKCESDRVLEIRAHAKDSHSYKLGNKEADGVYAAVFGCGDDTEIDVCLDCGYVQDNFPIPDEALEGIPFETHS